MMGVMGEMQRLEPDQFQELADQMRMANTVRLKNVIDSLEAYIDGTLGAVSPAHVNAYVKTVRELGLLWRVYDRPEVAQDSVDEVEVAKAAQVALVARQEAVLAELGKLREVSARRVRS
jgi:hypothetical protein